MRPKRALSPPCLRKRDDDDDDDDGGVGCGGVDCGGVGGGGGGGGSSDFESLIHQTHPLAYFLVLSSVIELRIMSVILMRSVSERATKPSPSGNFT